MSLGEVGRQVGIPDPVSMRPEALGCLLPREVPTIDSLFIRPRAACRRRSGKGCERVLRPALFDSEGQQHKRQYPRQHEAARRRRVACATALACRRSETARTSRFATSSIGLLPSWPASVLFFVFDFIFQVSLGLINEIAQRVVDTRHGMIDFCGFGHRTDRQAGRRGCGSRSWCRAAPASTHPDARPDPAC